MVNELTFTATTPFAGTTTLYQTSFWNAPYVPKGIPGKTLFVEPRFVAVAIEGTTVFEIFVTNVAVQILSFAGGVPVKQIVKSGVAIVPE